MHSKLPHAMGDGGRSISPFSNQMPNAISGNKCSNELMELTRRMENYIRCHSHRRLVNLNQIWTSGGGGQLSQCLEISQILFKTLIILCNHLNFNFINNFVIV